MEGGKEAQVTGPVRPPGGLAVTTGGIYYPAGPDSNRQYLIESLNFSNGQIRPVVTSDRPVGALAISARRAKGTPAAT